VPGHGVCGGSNVGQSFIIDYRAGRPVSACGAVQAPVRLCVCGLARGMQCRAMGNCGAVL